jgi:hypothetical protein
VRGLSVLVHGGPKAGKSWFGDTTPAPRLILDAEGGSWFTTSRKVPWDPTSQQPPVADGTWDTAIVDVREYDTVKRAYEWLNSGQHPFRSVVMDSISEIQQRCIDNIAGVDPMQTQNWGTLLREMSKLVRNYRDLLRHPTKPLEAMVIIAMTRVVDGGRQVPYVQGQLATTLPYYIDVIGFIANQADEQGHTHRYLMVQPDPRWLTGERVGGRLGTHVELFDNYGTTMSDMLDSVFGADGEAAPAAPAEPPPTVQHQ